MASFAQLLESLLALRRHDLRGLQLALSVLDHLLVRRQLSGATLSA